MAPIRQSDRTEGTQQRHPIEGDEAERRHGGPGLLTPATVPPGSAAGKAPRYGLAATCLVRKSRAA
jgi:hypothetical protein